MLRILLSLAGCETYATLTVSYPQSKAVCNKYCFISPRLPSSNIQHEWPRWGKEIGFESNDGDTQDIVAVRRCDQGRNTIVRLNSLTLQLMFS